MGTYITSGGHLGDTGLDFGWRYAEGARAVWGSPWTLDVAGQMAGIRSAWALVFAVVVAAAAHVAGVHTIFA